MPPNPFFKPIAPTLFKPDESADREVMSPAKIPSRKMVQMILDNNFEKKVLKNSSYKMVVEGLDCKNVINSLKNCRVISYCNGRDVEDPRALEGKTIITFDNWQWTIHFETGVLNIQEGDKEYNLLCELLWSAL